MIRRRRSNPRREAFEGINITPFTDILLVLLIIFMIAGSAMAPSGLALAELGQPETGSHSAGGADGLMVLMPAEGESPRMLLEGRTVSWAELERLPSTTPVTLRIAAEVTSEQIVSLVDRLSAVGLRKVQWGPPASATEFQQ